MRSMERFECIYILDKELKQGIGRRFKKAYTLSDGSIKLSLDGISYIITPGKRVSLLTEDRRDYRDSGFTQKLRKELHRRPLDNIELLRGDRVFVFTFQEYKLYVQIYGKGALILVKGNEELISINKARFHPQETSLESLIEAYAEKPIGAVLVRFIGKKYAKALIKRMGIEEKRKAADFIGRIEDIKKGVEEMLEEAKPRSCPADYTLLPEEGCKEVESLSKAMDIYYKTEEVDIEREKLLRNIEKQREKVREYIQKAALYRKIARWLFSHSHEVDELIKKARKGEGTNIDKKNKTFVISLELE